MDAFALEVITRNFQSSVPCLDGVLDARRANPVIALRKVGREFEVVWLQLEGLPVEGEGFVENGVFIDFEMFARGFSMEVNRDGQVVMVDRFEGSEVDGLLVVVERLFDRARMTINIREIVPRGRVVRFEFPGFLPLFGRFLLASLLIEKSAKGQPRAGVSGMAQKKGTIGVLHLFLPLFDPQDQGLLAESGAFFTQAALLQYPFVDFLMSRVVLLEQSSIRFFRGVVWVGNSNGDAGFLLVRLAGGGGGLACGQQRAEETN